jgi:anthranilate synthase component 2
LKDGLRFVFFYFNMTRLLVFDNYDSFTYNLVHLVEKLLHIKVDVYKNDEIPLEKIGNYDKIILSPGPGLPDEAGLLKPLIKEYAASKSILGVCLGHQAIAEVFGATLKNLENVYHGVSTPIIITDIECKIFKDMPVDQLVGRYHSWVVCNESLPACLKVTAIDKDQNIMGLQHIQYDIQGVQFHPESIMTPCGEQLLLNWLSE